MPAENAPSAAALAAENAELKAENAELNARLAERDRTVSELKAEIAALKEQLAELLGRLGKNSRNSSKPPSSDGLSKPKTQSSRKPGGRKPGGQPGHRGSTLERSETPDRIIDHVPEACAGCGAGLGAGSSVSHAARQVHDLPDPQPLFVTEHRAHRCRCGACGEETAAPFPEGVRGPVQYGPRIVSLILYFSVAQLIPVKRMCALLRDVFGVSLSQGTVAAVIRRGADRCAGFWTHLRRLAAAAPVKHFDETGARIAGGLRWIHVACTQFLCHFRLGESRGDVMAEAAGIAVHDHFGPYFNIEGVEHAGCNAHNLRDLQWLVETGDEVWAENLGFHLVSAIAAADKARRRGTWLTEQEIADFEEHYRLLVGDGIDHHESLPPLSSKRKGRPKRRKGHNLAIRLRDFQDETLRFLRNPLVPPTNNQAEQDLRPQKTKQKISGCFRTAAGAADFLILRSVIETGRKQRWNLLWTLSAAPSALFERLNPYGPIPDT